VWERYMHVKVNGRARAQGRAGRQDRGQGGQ
jgi:hypothetical protein